MKRLRVYVDTSVVGGCVEAKFADASLGLFERGRRGEITLVISELLTDELLGAPEAVANLINVLPEDSFTRIDATPESERLRDLYLAAGVVSPASISDAHHVALATLADADVLVSWNFKHLVHVDKMRGFNAVNMRENLRSLDIRSPEEVR